MNINMEWMKILFACLILYIVKCAEARNEIEEFTEFLYKTSQLDQILKKGNDFEDDDDDQSPSDHAWEESGKFEGDLILNDRQRRLLIEDVAEGLSRNGLKDSTKKWPDNEVIYYIQKEHFTDDQIQAIESGIDDITRASCVKFRPYKRGDRDAVVIQGSRRGCFSQVGYQGGYQVLNLSGRHPVGRGCFRHGTVVHELLHSLGFYHMQSSPDRDEYIDVLWENIIEPARHNFRKYNSFAVTDFGVGYDYDSVLHYSRRAFSANGQDTLVPKRRGASIGQRIGLSDKDTQKLNKMYCDGAGENDSDDVKVETTPKPPQTQKKQNSNNKPFDGHGIGYHQGKTVIIKLPAAKTYKLSDLPSFYMFDYFSKAPQTVQPSLFEGFGVGQEIDHPVHDKHESSRRNQSKISGDETASNLFNITEIRLPNKEMTELEQSEHDGDIPNSNTGKMDDGLEEAFERLSKIIKAHVYPSQLPDFSIYNPKDFNKKYKNNVQLNRPREQNEKLVHEKEIPFGKDIENETKMDDENQKELDNDTDIDKSKDTENISYSYNSGETSDSPIRYSSNIKKYTNPFTIHDHENLLSKKTLTDKIYSEPTSKIKEAYKKNKGADRDESKYFPLDFKKHVDEDFSKSHEAYKKLLKDNRSKHNYGENSLDLPDHTNLE